MKTLRDYDEAEGLAKFTEIEPYISEIFKDEDIKINEMTNFQLGATALKKHPEACKAIFKAFECEPASPQGQVAAIATVLVDIIADKDMIDFFLFAGRITEKE